MEELRMFLRSRPPMKRKSDGNVVWQDLVKRLKQAEQHHEDNVSEDMKKVSNRSLILRLRDFLDGRGECVDTTVSTCLEALSRAVEASSQPHYAMLNPDYLPLVDKTLSVLHMLHSSKTLPVVKFLRGLLKLKDPAPVELLWKLHKMDLMQITTFVTHWRKDNDNEDSHLPHALLWLLTQSDHGKLGTADIAKDVLIALLQTVKLNPIGCSQLLASSSVALLQNFSKQVVDWVLNQPPKQSEVENEGSLLLNLSSEMLTPYVCQDNVCWFALTLLLQLLSEHTDLTTASSLCSIVRNQCTEWTLEVTPKPLKNILSLVVQSLGAQEIATHIAQSGVKPQVNWRITLLLTTVLVKTLPEAEENMNQITDQLLRRGLEGGRKNELFAALLLARQCCHCQCPSFGNYASWFSKNFGSDSTTAHNPKQFTLLLKLLTELVPAETADTLRVHLNKVPQAPINCHSLLCDYTVLAKTRLADLNESAELPCLFADNRQVSISGMDMRKADIIRVLDHFQRTKEVIKPVIEAAIFRRQYYREIFLVELLGLSSSSKGKSHCQSETGVDENLRHEFISKLYAMRKIPDDMFKEYSEKRVQKVQSETKLKDIGVAEKNVGDCKPERSVERVGDIDRGTVNDIEKQKNKKRLQVRPKRKCDL